MQHKFRLILPVLVLILAGLACTLIPATETPDVVATQVAQTLAAAEGESPAPTPGSGESSPEPDTPLPPSPTPNPTPRRFVYTADGNVHLWTVGGSPAELTTSGDATDVKISDDGQVIAFIRKVDDAHEELWAINADGSNLRNLVSAADFDAMTSDPDMITTRVWTFDFVPGTHNVAYNTLPYFEGPGLILNDDLRLVDADTSSQTTLLSPGQGGEFTYSPDGSRIAVVSPQSVLFVNPDGSGRSEVLSFPSILTYSEYQFYPRAVWLPDGSAVRIVIPPKAALDEPTPPSKVWHIPTDGSSPRELFSFTAAPLSFEDYALTPDGGKLAYMQTTGSGGAMRELHIIQADGSGDTNYDSGELTFEAWSTDGSRFIYSRRGENPRIGQVGSAPQPITGTTRISSVSWINPTQFIFLNRDSGSVEIWLGDMGASNTLIDTSGSSITYDFTP